MKLKTALSLLLADLSVYKPDWNLSAPSLSLYLLFIALLRCRDFRLNVFVRAQQAHIPVVSRLSHSLIFYLYGSTIDPGSFLGAPIRFVHARNIVIGKHVRMSGQCILIFHNVTLGKLRPGESSQHGSMPLVHGPVVFGSGSTVLGGVSVSPHVVFGASSLCTLPQVESYSTLVGYNLIHSGVYYETNLECQLKPAF
jgi:serine acetyltransferase